MKKLLLVFLLCGGAALAAAQANQNNFNGGGSSGTSTAIISPAKFVVPASVTSLNAFGDSLTDGTGLSTAQVTSIWANLVALGWKLPYTNLAHGGARFGDAGFIPTAYQQTPGTSVGSIAIIGTNDSPDASSAATQTQIGWAAQAMMVWLGLPSANIELATSMTQAGTWSTTTDFNLTSVFSSTANSTLTGTVNGTAVYVAGVWGSGINMSTNISIDGTPVCTSVCVVTWDLTASTHYPWCMRFGGLSPGNHTVVIKNVTGGGSNLTDIQWIAGNGSTAPGIFEAYGNTPSRTGVSNTNVQALNAVFAANVANLASDGLDIFMVDDFSAIAQSQNPPQYENGNLHPDTFGNQLLAAKWFDTLGSASFSASQILALLQRSNAGPGPMPNVGAANTLSGQIVAESVGGNINYGVTSYKYQTASTASCTTGSSAGSTCTTTINWGTAFGDGNYIPNCTMGGTPVGVPYVIGTSSIASGSIVVTIANLTAVAASGTIECFAFHP